MMLAVSWVRKGNMMNLTLFRNYFGWWCHYGKDGNYRESLNQTNSSHSTMHSLTRVFTKCIRTIPSSSEYQLLPLCSIDRVKVLVWHFLKRPYFNCHLNHHTLKLVEIKNFPNSWLFSLATHSLSRTIISITKIILLERIHATVKLDLELYRL